MGSSFDALLNSVRVLDLADQMGFLCGRLLGDFGADVIKIEKPGGDTSRNTGPFHNNIPDSNKSLYWMAYNANKRSITLDLETEDGRKLFLRLVKTSDVVLESFPPGYMDNMGLSYAVLEGLNPRLISVSVTPFGNDGPYRDYKGPDIVLQGLGGMMYLSGDSDRAPLRMDFPQSPPHAGATGALGAIIALYHRNTSGKGQFVDVSAQAAVVKTLMNARSFWDLNRTNLCRAGLYRAGLSSKARQRFIWKCKDGYVNFIIFGGETGARTNRPLTEWMDSEGMAPQFMKDMKWKEFDMAMATEEEFVRLSEPISKFFQKHTMKELYEGALKRRLMLYPVNDIKGIVESDQLSAREFWTTVEYPGLNAILTCPGAIIKLSETPCRTCRPAPQAGEHNREIYMEELGLSTPDFNYLKQFRVI